MVLLATSIFFASLVGIVILFSVKAWEGRRGKVIASGIRSHADRRSLDLKQNLTVSSEHLSKVPPLLNRLAWFTIHEFALGFATLAQWIERQAHKLADFVSQKHRFERRKTNSEFLKKVSDHMNEKGNGQKRDEEENI